MRCLTFLFNETRERNITGFSEGIKLFKAGFIKASYSFIVGNDSQSDIAVMLVFLQQLNYLLLQDHHCS